MSAWLGCLPTPPVLLLQPTQFHTEIFASMHESSSGVSVVVTYHAQSVTRVRVVVRRTTTLTRRVLEDSRRPPQRRRRGGRRRWARRLVEAQH